MRFSENLNTVKFKYMQVMCHREIIKPSGLNSTTPIYENVTNVYININYTYDANLVMLKSPLN